MTAELIKSIWKKMKEGTDIHPHCKDCIKIWKCTVPPKEGESCKIISCDFNCGARFHLCKTEEHQLLCLNEKVPCINVLNGCPAKMLRKYLGTHLATCPASVIHCKMEWNRWPVHFPHQIQLHHQRPLHEMQLDVALAMRDQRMLQQSLQMSSQYALCSSPIKYSAMQSQNRSQIELNPEKLYGNYYTNGMDKNENEYEKESHCKGDWMKLCASYDDILFVNNVVISDISSAPMTDCSYSDVNSVPTMPDGSYVPPGLTIGLNLNLETRTRHQSKSKSMFTFICGQDFRRDEYCWHYKNVHSDIHGGLNGWIEQRCPLAVYGCTFAHRRLNPMPKGSIIVHSEQLESFGVQPPTLKYFHALATEKTSQQNCQVGPLIKEKIQVEFNSSINILHLPFRILQHIARYLDSFSLSNLSLTSVLLRDVCCSLLEDRGIVVFRWERHKIGENYTWKIANKRWFFSTSFTPIEEWCFEDSSISDHLRICPLFQRNIKAKPYFCLGLDKKGGRYH